MKVAEIVTNKIIERINKGDIPWKKPWRDFESVNWLTQQAYRGVNRFLLPGGEFATYKQVTEHGGKVKKGAKPEIVVFYKPLKKLVPKDEGNPEELIEQNYFTLRYYTVYNIKDCEGIESKYKEEPTEPINKIKECEDLFNSYYTREHIKRVSFDLNSAYYSRSEDLINIPPLNSFYSSEGYYSALAHETVHSTGISFRLNRNMGGIFGSKEYAREELVAELGAAMLCHLLKIDNSKTLDNSAAYCESWSKALSEDSSLFLYASAKAEKAMNFILTGEKSI